MSGHSAFDEHDHATCAHDALARADRMCAERAVKLTPIRRQVLEILATDPGSKADFAAWSRATGHELMLATQEGTVFRYEVRKK